MIGFFIKFVHFEEIKVHMSEKATTFCEILTLLLSYVMPFKSKISQSFVAFSEYMNLKKTGQEIPKCVKVQYFHTVDILSGFGMLFFPVPPAQYILGQYLSFGTFDSFTAGLG